MYTFYIDGVERTPDNAGALNIDFEKNEDNGALFFRKVLSDSLVFSGPNYDYFAGISDICQEITFRIDQQCTGGVQTIFEGITAITKCSFNPDRCIVEVNVTPDDSYSCILDNIDKEINILDETNRYDDLEIYEAAGLQLIIQLDSDPPPANYQASGSPVVNGETFRIYQRVVVTTECVAGVPQQPPAFLGISYTLLNNDCAVTGTSTWWRTLTIGENGIIASGLGWTFCTPLPCTPPAIPANTTLVNLALGVNTSVNFYLDDASFTFDSFNVQNGRYLTNVIDYMLTELGCSLTLSSDFFTNATNPVTGNPSTTKDLLLYEKSDVVRPNASEKATKSLLTIGELLNDLSILFNVRWKITGANLVVEHISDLAQAVGLDLTTLDGGKWIGNKNAFDYIDDEIPLEEKYKYPIEARGIDFIGYPIDYNTQCSTLSETIHQTRRTETELPRILNNDDEGLDGVVLVSPNTVNRWALFSDLAENGRITGEFQPNAPLGYGALIPDYHTWDRPLPEGDINQVNTVMDSTMPIKKQQELRFPFCCLNDFDPIELVKTSIGDGEVLEASYNLKTKNLILSLGYQI